MNTKINIIKLFSGDMVIGENITNTDGVYCIENPRMLVLSASMQGNVQMFLTSVCAPFKSEALKKNVKIPVNQVFYMINEEEIDNALLNAYKSEISGIKLATAADMSLLNTPKNNNGDIII